MGPVSHGVRICRSGGHTVTDGVRECLTCKKARDDIHRANARKAGKDAARGRDWYRTRYRTDPDFRAAEIERSRVKDRSPEGRLRGRLGVSMAVAREILEVTR